MKTEPSDKPYTKIYETLSYGKESIQTIENMSSCDGSKS